MTVPDLPDTGLDLVAATITARTAAILGAPRLATLAARRAAALAEQFVIELSPVVARTSPATEAEVTGSIRTTGSLCRLLAPAPGEVEER